MTNAESSDSPTSEWSEISSLLARAMPKAHVTELFRETNQNVRLTILPIEHLFQVSNPAILTGDHGHRGPAEHKVLPGVPAAADGKVVRDRVQDGDLAQVLRLRHQAGAAGARAEGLPALAGPGARGVRQGAPSAERRVGALPGDFVSFILNYFI